MVEKEKPEIAKALRHICNELDELSDRLEKKGREDIAKSLDAAYLGLRAAMLRCEREEV